MSSESADEPMTSDAPAQLGLFPTPCVTVEYFPDDYFVTTDGAVERGCFRAAIQGLGSWIGEGLTVQEALRALAVSLRAEANATDGAVWRTELPDVRQSAAWVVQAAARLGSEELARWLDQWVNEPVLGTYVGLYSPDPESNPTAASGPGPSRLRSS